MENLIPIISLSLVAFLLGIVIFVISKKFYVKTDPKVDLVYKLLPHVNCGACGYPSCMKLAEVLVNTRDSSKICPVGGDELSDRIGQVLGIKMAKSKPVICAVRCGGTNEKVKLTAEYKGIADCWAITQAYTGPKKCPYSCIGFGSCIPVCNYDALKIESGLIKVIEDRCVGCGACITKCPRNILVMQEKKDKRYFVSCMSENKGASTRQNCSVGCIACNLCVKACKFNAVVVKDFLSVIDEQKCTSCGECIKVCPTKCIVLREDKVSVEA